METKGKGRSAEKAGGTTDTSARKGRADKQ